VARKSSLEVWKSKVTKLMLIFLNFYATHEEDVFFKIGRNMGGASPSCLNM